MKRVKIKFNLDKALIQNVTKRSRKKGTWAACDHLLTVSKQQVPLDQGPLKNSGAVDVADDEQVPLDHNPLMKSGAVDVADDGSQATVSYDTPYAVRQHEELSYRHQRGRKAKYLEDPCNDTTVHAGMTRAAQKAMENDWK